MASSDAEGDVPVTFADLGLTSEAATVETFVGTVSLKFKKNHIIIVLISYFFQFVESIMN